MSKRAIVVLGVGVAISVAKGTFAFAPHGNACVATKNLAAAKYYECRAKVRHRAEPGEVLDFSRCSTRLSRTFNRLRDKFGYCPVASVSLQQTELRVDAADQAIESLILPAPPITLDEQRCAMARRKLTARYVRCEADARADELLRRAPRDRRCFNTFYHALYLKERWGDACVGLQYELNNASGTARSQLSGADFEGMDLGSVDFTLAELGDVNFERAYLASAEFPNANLSGAVLNEANLGSASFVGADLRDAKLVRVYIDGAPFDGANLEDAILAAADLFGASFADCNLSNANFSGAELNGVRFDRADLSAVEFDESDFAYVGGVALATCPQTLPAGWVCLSATLFGPTAAVNDAILDGINLDGVDLTGAQLSWASFVGASLVGTNFTMARLTGTQFVGADMTNADLTDADPFATNLDDTNLSGANLSRFDFRFTYMDGADMTGVVWNSTFCADGSRSSDQVPESCCGTFGPYGQPVACSP
jgi:uncharacterized protein YjbI with pentapeptide repeats